MTGRMYSTVRRTTVYGTVLEYGIYVSRKAAHVVFIVTILNHSSSQLC
jgi:hypothetical protein